ncbi:ATP-binding protein [Patescibacteria group bacterium]|nr:ATP-binding protein [Patescibacteria group bacterium]
MIANVNWNNFRVKFDNQNEVAFERLCYLLFCKEFNKNLGIFRFKNHAGIETNPVEHEGKIIGWQAKFYSTALSQHTADFKESIDKTKERHPEVNKIIFYTNQEFGQDKMKTDPRYKKDLETHAKSNGVEIEWRTGSYFESLFVSEDNFSIAQHFFDLKPGIIDSIIELQKYTDQVLQPIRSQIAFGENSVKLDRSSIVGGIRDTAKNFPIVVLSGGAGVGKTAVVKDLYEAVKESTPYLVFKATQFKSATHINQLFKDYGEITATEFIAEHKDINEKYVVFDSSERLSEIEDQDVFRMFLSELVTNGWTVIFTVRHSYLDDLRFQLKEFYGTNFASLNIPYLSTEEVEKISKEFKFEIPKNARLANLLLTPLYLSEYLQDYSESRANISYNDFRETIWKKQIQNSSYQSNNLHRRREECFLKVAKQRANEGGFFVKTDESDHEALQKLGASEIIKFDSKAGGYFITHDVYEEWALDILIERAFNSASDYQSFYAEIGNSLPIRRAFRNWLSDKLFANDDKAKKLIEFTVQDSSFENHWKDEVLVSVLLSDYSEVFFELFEKELLTDPERVVSVVSATEGIRVFDINYQIEKKLIHRILFLLRIACKTVDEDFLSRLGLSRANALSLETIFTTPKGSGWSSTIAFINKHKDKFKLMYMHVILPVLDDWNRSHQQGETTKNASQIALFYYNTLTAQKDFYFGSRDSTKEPLIRTILNGSGEIKEELSKIIKAVVLTKDTTHRSRYYELVNTILSSILDSTVAARNLPKEVIKLANLFWFDNSPEDEYSHLNYRNDLEQYYGLTSGHLDYYPASAYQTPIGTLLQTAPQETVNFILAFTNKVIEYFSKSELGNEAEYIDVIIDEVGTTVKQYIGHRIWNIYRGTQTNPPLLESIHMALESWLLWLAKTYDVELVENWCFYLIKHSRSTSITAIVVSVVLAEPTKLFNVAKILLKNKDFFFFDLSRLQLDRSHAKFSYSMAHDPGGIFRNERLQTCEDKHRERYLENQALNYQLFSDEGEKEDLAKGRQEAVWKILDEHYAKLPNKKKETNSDKTWRLTLARMDRRKMKISTEEKDKQIFISFNPEIDPELRQYSENAQAKSSEALKYTPLQLWSHNKFEKNEDAKKYLQYEDGHDLTLSETKTILEKLTIEKDEGSQFRLFYHSVPAYVCSVLLRDYAEELSPEDAEFCKDIVLDYASMPLREGYSYQIGDGLEAAVNILPLLIKKFPKDAAKIKEVLLLILFDSYPIGTSQRVSDYAVASILQYLWPESPNDANAILYGYLLLKPKFDQISESIREENRKNQKRDFSRIPVLKRFKKECKTGIKKVVSSQLSYGNIQNAAEIDPDVLVTAFLLVPLKTTDADHKKFLRDISPTLIEAFKNEDREERLDYVLEHRFLDKFAHFVLYSPKEEIEAYVEPFIELIGDFRRRKDVADVFEAFIIAEDAINQYEEFWIVWQVFYPKIVELCSDEHHLRYSENVVYKYLLAVQWNKAAKEWHSLKDRERAFFKKVSEEMGGNAPVLYALAKLLNDIGSNFATDGIAWISGLLQKNSNLSHKELEVNTVYYLENLVRSYILKNRQKIKTDPQLKKQILVILDFLLEKASVTAYLLREDIL